MKKLKALFICVFVTIACMHASAQQVPINEPDYNKPAIFADLPSKMSLNLPEVQSLFELKGGSSFGLQLTDQLFLKGLVISNGSSGPGVQTVMLRVVNRGDLNLSISRITLPDGSIAYRGRGMNRANSDALEIKKEEDLYIVKKINVYDLISE